MSAAKITTSYRVNVVANLDEPLRLASCAATTIRVTVGSEYPEPRVHATGYAYRSDGSIGRTTRSIDWVPLDALPDELVAKIKAAHNRQLVELATGEPYAPASEVDEAAGSAHTHDEP